MDVIGGIAAATEGLKLINELRKIDKEVDKADLKLRLVDLADKLLDAKQALQTAQETEFELRAEIAKLGEKLELKARLKDQNGQLFELDNEGNGIGALYCNLCYVKEEKLYRLRHFEAKQGSYAHYHCDNCNTNIVTGPSLPRPASGGRSWMDR